MIWVILLLLPAVFSVITCPEGYEFGYFGCYYFKTIQAPNPITNPICNNPNDKVLTKDPEEFNTLKSYYDSLFEGNTSLENNVVVLRNGSYVTYLCYTNPGIYNKNYTVRSIIREHFDEVNQQLQYLPMFSLYIGGMTIAFLLGRFLGIGIYTLGVLSIIAMLDLAGYLTIPWEFYAIATIIPVAITLAFIFAILMQR